MSRARAVTATPRAGFCTVAMKLPWRWNGNRRHALVRWEGYTLAIWREANGEPYGEWGEGVWHDDEEIHVGFHARWSSWRAKWHAVMIAMHDKYGPEVEPW